MKAALDGNMLLKQMDSEQCVWKKDNEINLPLVKTSPHLQTIYDKL